MVPPMTTEEPSLCRENVVPEMVICGGEGTEDAGIGIGVRIALRGCVVPEITREMD